MSELKKNVLRAIAEHQMLSYGDRVLCCVSGGADSVAMLHLLSNSAEELGVSVFAIHINHGLRGEESDRDELFVRRFCEENGIKLTVHRLNIPTEHSVEETAREMRYRAFFDAAKEFSCNRIATAHTEDDQAETVLFHLARGSGLHGLTGIPATRNEIIRPLLWCSRNSVIDYLTEHKISYCEDSSNASVVFSRNRIRHRVLPELRKINSSATQAIAKTATLLAQDEDFILKEAERCLSVAASENNVWRYPCETLINLHPSLQARVILSLARNAMQDQTYCLESSRICEITKLLFSKSPSSELHLPSGLVVRRVYSELEFAKHKDVSTVPCRLFKGESCRFGRFEIHWLSDDAKIHKNFILYEIDSAIIDDCIIVRGRMVGDCIKLHKRPKKSLKQFMIDAKIEKQLRGELPVLCDGENLILVHMLGVDERYVRKNDQEKIRIEIGLCFDETERNTDQ